MKLQRYSKFAHRSSAQESGNIKKKKKESKKPVSKTSAWLTLG